MSPVRTWAGLGAAAILALSIGFGASYLLHGPVDTTSAMLSGEADISTLFSTRFPDVNGRETTLEEWKGKILVVNFWATWCSPCRDEIPDFIRLQREFGPRGIQFVGIAADQPDKVGPFVAEFEINYPVMLGDFGALELARRTGNKVGALPYTLVLDQRGRLVHRQLGILKSETLRRIFGQLL